MLSGFLALSTKKLEVAMDQKGWNEEDKPELKVLLGPLPLPQKGDWINAEDRAWMKNQW